ncbi:hypothetical protein Lepil_4042 [Leptonema illini DSM 21528]|uniref:Uncharacterized protein n=1 Tax=Leptonema illini DSM 21528 TaxID=929563 RepID=H2CC17_9LEPT|nr:hypothetical protein Lepil_4042 [Leptonema illini DSM 21528]
MIRRLPLIFTLSIAAFLPAGCEPEESTTKDEFMLGLLIQYWVNYNNPCKDGRPYMEVNQGDLVGPFTSQQCFHLTTTSAVTITMLTTGTSVGSLTLWTPVRTSIDYRDDPTFTISQAPADVWVFAQCGGCEYSIQF